MRKTKDEISTKLIEIEKTYKDRSVTIANSMIRSREHTNLLESKMEVLAIHHMDIDMKQREKRDAEGKVYKVNYVEVPASEIRRLMNRTDGDTYTDIRNAAVHMKGKIFLMEEKDSHQFYLKSMYGDISYDDGILHVEFEPEMEKYFLNLKDNFTKLKLPILFSFKKNGGFQLYKLLKSYTYPPRLAPIDMSLSQEELPTIQQSWNITDLRMIMGYVDITQAALKEESAKKKPNWEKMAKEEKHPKYKRWGDFYTRVIEPGINEINSISDIYIKEIRKETAGRGGKISSITFVVQHNKQYYEKASPVKEGEVKEDRIMYEDQIDDFIDEMRLIIKNEEVKTKDLKAIAEVAGYEMDRIRAAYKVSQKKSDISNFTGWMIDAIRKDYSSVRQEQEKEILDNVYGKKIRVS